MVRRKRSSPVGLTTVDALVHNDKRKNLPTADAQDFVSAGLRAPVKVRYPRDPALDPQLVWAGKDEQDAEDLSVDAPPLYIQEKVDPRVLTEDLRRTGGRAEDAPALFEDFDGIAGWQSIEYYQHAANWSNRLILGDSLQVMASLAERENLRGQVQMIYVDPPYGIKFGSNWQARTDSRNVKDGKLGDATREIEQIKAFRDTWERGVSSYLAYLRDRFVAGRELLTESGSIFVQIGDENVHLVRTLLDEVFGTQNFVSQITIKKLSGVDSTNLPATSDFILFYAKNIGQLKYRPLFLSKGASSEAALRYDQVILADGSIRPAAKSEKTGESALPEGARRFQLDNLIGAEYRPDTTVPFELDGRVYHPGVNSHWKTTLNGLARLGNAHRLRPTGKSTLRYVRMLDDFPGREVGNVWTDISGSVQSRSDPKIYVVQSSTALAQRCMLLATDPGDLVLDPTCGSGTTATVAEQWGRRWITIDTSRVALTLARQRIMGARYPHYILLDSPAGAAKEAELIGGGPPVGTTKGDIRKGFVYRRVPHVTLKSIANDPSIVEGMSREEADAAIAKNAESELLYDQPYEDAKAVRVAGRFTVEGLLPYRALGDDGIASASEAASEQDSTSSFEKMLLENLQRSGVQNGRKSERFEFDSVELVPGKHLAARAIPGGHLVDERVAISIGPRYGTVGADWIKAAAREAMRGQGHDVLLILGFAFDPYALETVAEFAPGLKDDAFQVQAEHQAGSIRVLLVRMNADLAMGESLLKKTKAANLFTVFGEPDIAPPQWTEDGWVVTIRGFDVYNPLTGEVRAGSEQDIAMWMIDTDYNEESFFVRHAYFLGSDPYTQLRRALVADIDESSWESLNSVTSRPFPHPTRGKAAIKVINHYGDELLSVLELKK